MPSLTRCTPLSLENWRAIDERTAAPTFTARPAWTLAWCEAFPNFVPTPIECRLQDGETVFVPLLQSRARLGWRVCTGMPWGECTTVLRADGTEALPSTAQAALRAIAAHSCDALEVTLWPLGVCGNVSLAGRTTTGEISVIDLANGAEAAIAAMDGKSRRMAGQAERRGVSCALAESPDAVDTYFDMLESSAKRWGLERPTISKQLLQSVVKYGGTDTEIWFAQYEGKPIAGGVVLFGSQELYFWSAAMYSEFSVLRPSNALNVALIRRAAARGRRWYNLSSSSGLAGVERFKEGLGARRVTYATVTVRRPAYAAYSALRAVLNRRNS